MQSVTCMPLMLSVVMLSVVMLSVVAPKELNVDIDYGETCFIALAHR
jgi:hypothetical protein